MSDTRRANCNWTVCDPDATSASWDGAQLAVLMDIRDELKRLNALLHCSNFIAIPNILRDVKRNTARKRKRKPRLKAVA